MNFQDTRQRYSDQTREYVPQLQHSEKWTKKDIVWVVVLIGFTGFNLIITPIYLSMPHGSFIENMVFVIGSIILLAMCLG
jgi:hypothetical protein